MHQSTGLRWDVMGHGLKMLGHESRVVTVYPIEYAHWVVVLYNYSISHRICTLSCWSTFRKSNSKQQLGCRFDIMDYESYFFVFWHMQLYMSWYIISFFGFTFLNIFIFSSTLVLTFSYRRNLYTFYSIVVLYNYSISHRICTLSCCALQLQ